MQWSRNSELTTIKLYQYYQKAVIHKESGIAKHIVQECVCWDD